MCATSIRPRKLPIKVQSIDHNRGNWQKINTRPRIVSKQVISDKEEGSVRSSVALRGSAVTVIGGNDWEQAPNDDQ